MLSNMLIENVLTAKTFTATRPIRGRGLSKSIEMRSRRSIESEPLTGAHSRSAQARRDAQ